MALTTYAELQTALADTIHRADLTSHIPDFIKLCESRVARKLRNRAMQNEADISITGGTRTAALPTGFLEARRFYLNSSPISPLEYISSDDYWKRYLSSNTAKPSVFTIEGTNLVLGPIPDASYTGKLLFYKALDALSATAHGTFTANPDLYLYGSLAAGEVFLKNDKRFPLWKGMYEEILKELNDQDARQPGTMRMRDDYNPY
jgi:hypothetical protein